jgi:hypothetical protein
MIEPDYYPLAMAAEKIDCTTNYLICLAAEDKLSIYVRLVGKEAMEYPNPFEPEEGDYPEPCYLPSICKVSIYNIQAWQNDRSTDLHDLINIKGHCGYSLKESIPLKGVALLVSAEDVARLSKKETVKTDGGEIAEMNADKALAVMALLLSNQLPKYRSGYKPNASAISKDVLPIAQNLFGDDDAKFASFNKRLGKALKQFKE